MSLQDDGLVQPARPARPVLAGEPERVVLSRRQRERDLPRATRRQQHRDLQTALGK